MRQIQRQTRHRQEESQKPVKALWKSSYYENVSSKVKEKLEVRFFYKNVILLVDHVDCILNRFQCSIMPLIDLQRLERCESQVKFAIDLITFTNLLYSDTCLHL